MPETGGDEPAQLDGERAAGARSAVIATRPPGPGTGHASQGLRVRAPVVAPPSAGDT